MTPHQHLVPGDRVRWFTMAQGGCCSYSNMGTVTIALLQLAADDLESEVWCLTVEETGYLCWDSLMFHCHSVWEASNCRNTKPIFVWVIQYLNTFLDQNIPPSRLRQQIHLESIHTRKVFSIICAAVICLSISQLPVSINFFITAQQQFW